LVSQSATKCSESHKHNAKTQHPTKSLISYQLEIPDPSKTSNYTQTRHKHALDLGSLSPICPVRWRLHDNWDDDHC